MLYMAALKQATDFSLLCLNYLHFPVANLEPTSPPIEGEAKCVNCSLSILFWIKKTTNQPNIPPSQLPLNHKNP